MQRYDKKSVTRITFYYNFISKVSKKCDGNHCCQIPSNESAVPEHTQNTYYKSKKKPVSALINVTKLGVIKSFTYL